QKKAVTMLLGRLGASDSDVLGALTQLAEERSEEPLIRNLAVVSLVRLAPDSFDYTKFFLRELKSDRYSLGRVIFPELPRDRALALLDRALADLPREKKFAAIESAGMLGESAAPLATAIEPFLENDEGAVRHSAVVAMLRIAPENPALEPVVRAELIGRFASSFAHERFSPRARALFERIVATPKSTVERLAAQSALGCCDGEFPVPSEIEASEPAGLRKGAGDATTPVVESSIPPSAS
ncbi:MAG: hypothetical protein IT290_03350, partial [Deltaproteobacteria bacterium]|nr:hypothetical protein [Deltaproteobacteria bacterium]